MVMNEPTIYMLVGVPGSGKSTWLSKQDKTNAVVLSTDDYIERVALASGSTYSDVFKNSIEDASQNLENELAVAIKGKKDIYWDQTNLTARARSKKLDKIPSEYRKVAVFFKTPDDAELKRRLSSRPGKIIPANILMAMRSQLEIPTVDEGFDRVIVV